MRCEVTEADTAIALGSGDVPVLATPRLIGWLEAATVPIVADHLATGQTSVGTAIRVRHRRATAVGGQVEVTAQLSTTEGSRMTLSVQAVDQDGQLVADGEIDRVIVDRAVFLRSI